jgi:predicted ATPase/DNA-binding winged helix-turn-helix (wHTH) protein
MAETDTEGGVVLSFGRFSLSPRERLLTANGAPVELGARALDILVALASRPNEVVGKRALLALVWPDVTVEEGSLRFHIAGLRKALGDGQDGARYISTLAGRGYCFVAPVTRSDRVGGHATPANAPSPRAFLPPKLARMVGREDDIGAIAAELAATRFVTIIGPGGVGKTTVAIAVAHELLPAFDGAVLFVDFGVLSEPRMVPASVASLLGLSVQSDDPVPSLIAFLRERRLLVVLDNCEHVIDEAAHFAARICPSVPGLHILATSREALRVEGEQVHRLSPLSVPPENAALSADDTWRYPAARLFVERARSAGSRVDFSEANAAIVASICRKLDGMALAIELAAGRVEAYGLDQLADLLDQRFTLLWPGQRTAPARQKTLRATLDWSYGLLTDDERRVFRRLAVFIGPFSIKAALAVVAGESEDAPSVFAAIDSLVAKSMVSTSPTGGMIHYRLLDTARSYALEITTDRAERDAVAMRHAAYCLLWLEPFAADGPPLSDAAERAPQLAALNNVRAALEWCFGADGDARLGVRLAAAATFTFFALSLITECQVWARRAIRGLDDASQRGAEAMHLQAGLALSSMFLGGNVEEALTALNASLDIARERGDALHQLRMLGLLHMFHHRAGDTHAAHACVTRSLAVASAPDAPAAMSLARALLGISLTLRGDLNAARAEFEAALQQRNLFLHGFDYRIIANGYLARVEWLRGYPTQAAEATRLNVAEAARSGHPVSVALALSFAIPLLLWLGDLTGAEEHIGRFIAYTETNSLPLSLTTAHGFQGQLAIARGDAKSGLALLEDSMRGLAAANYNVWTTPFNISRGQALFGLGRYGEAVALIDDTIRLTQENGDLTYMPELFRMKAAILQAVGLSGRNEVEQCLTDSLAWSDRQTALASALRAATDLAALLAGQGRPTDARNVLQPVFARFTEGFDTPDLIAAERVLAASGQVSDLRRPRDRK